MDNENEVLRDIINFVNMKPLDKMSFVTKHQARTVNMLDCLVNITKDK